MVKQQQVEYWQDIKEIWGNSYQREKINFQFPTLVEELKANASQWEKDSIYKDGSKISQLLK
jgi:hypothetical protein